MSDRAHILGREKTFNICWTLDLLWGVLKKTGLTLPFPFSQPSRPNPHSCRLASWSDVQVMFFRSGSQRKLSWSESLCAQHCAGALPMDTHNSLMRHKLLALFSNKKIESQEIKCLSKVTLLINDTTRIQHTPKHKPLLHTNCLPRAISQGCISERRWVDRNKDSLMKLKFFSGEFSS